MAIVESTYQDSNGHHSFTYAEGHKSDSVYTFTSATGRKAHFPAFTQADGTVLVDLRTLPTYGPMVLAFTPDRLRKMEVPETIIESAATSEPKGFVGFRAAKGGAAKQ